MVKRSQEALVRHRAKTRDYLRAKPVEYHMFTRAKDRANKSNAPFDITIEDIVTPSHCPYLGIPLFKGDKKQTHNSPSLDRINPEKGYVKGNVEVISNKANAMKYNATPDELVKFAQEILRRYVPNTD